MVTQLEESVSRVGFENPFYVVVHAANARLPARLSSNNVTRFFKVIGEVDFIREFEDYAELDDKTPPETIPFGLPKDRPILVCGFFGNICVRDQRDALKKAGYDAYIYQEATYF